MAVPPARRRLILIGSSIFSCFVSKCQVASKATSVKGEPASLAILRLCFLTSCLSVMRFGAIVSRLRCNWQSVVGEDCVFFIVAGGSVAEDFVFFVESSSCPGRRIWTHVFIILLYYLPFAKAIYETEHTPPYRLSTLDWIAAISSCHIEYIVHR